MKKLYYLSALALTGAMSVASCSSEEEVKPQNGKREEVKTSFTLSVGSVKPGTRMSADEVQADNAFNGMTGIQLFPFNCDPKVGVDGTNSITISPIHLADFNDFQEKAANARVYNDITIPVGVNNFVFYGMSLKADDGALKASYDNKALTSASTLANDVFFDLVSWNPGKTYKWFNTEQANGAKEVLDILNSVNTALTKQIAACTTTDDAGTTTTDPVATKLEDIQESLQALTAGSSNSVRLFLQKVYDRLVGLSSNYTAPVTAAIESVFNITGSTTTGYNLEWKTNPNFPGRYNLPDGAVAVTFGNDFQYDIKSVEGLKMTEVEKFMQPARLAYWVNTPAKTLNESYFDKNDPQNWKTVVDAYTTNAVSLSTQSVILEKQIQYAVARLDAYVKVTTAPVYDNGESKEEEDDQLGIVPQEGYEMTGVLIGGQKQVDWKLQPTGGSDEYTIYDKTMTKGIFAKASDSYSEVNHTLTLETEEKSKVRVCFEFVNTGNDFFGYNTQIIPAGSKFYLVTDLDPTKEKDATKTGNKVFKQDYNTIAKLTIGSNSLKNAYNVVPDLRSPKLKLGLSVDLEWQEGATYEHEF